MNKLFLLGLIGFAATNVFANSDLQPIKVNCDDVKLSLNTEAKTPVF